VDPGRLLGFVFAGPSHNPRQHHRKSLAPHALPRGATMFVQLPPETTGVRTENRYADPKMWGEFYQESGWIDRHRVAIGDYDGRTAARYFCREQERESCRLFRNLGGWKFEDVTAKAGVERPGGRCRDLETGRHFCGREQRRPARPYVSGSPPRTLLYINQARHLQGAGARLRARISRIQASWRPSATMTADGGSMFISQPTSRHARHPNGQRGYLLHNNRDGTFTNVDPTAPASAVNAEPLRTWWDYDNDGRPDLYVANDYGVPDKLYHNNRDGTVHQHR